MRTLILLLAFSDFAAAQKERLLWRGKSGPFTIEWTSANLRAFRSGPPSLPVLDLKKAAQAAWKKYGGDPKVDSLDYTYRLLSVVGSVLSYEESENCDCGGAHPSAYTRFHAIDLNTGNPVKLDTIFAPAILFKALAADSLVKQALLADAHPMTLDSLLHALDFQSVANGDCSYLFTRDILDSFAFYDVKGDQVAVRLSLPHAAETCRGSMVQLGIWLPIPATLQKPLGDAKGGREGHLMMGGNDARTEMQFSKQ